jgi:uncharacterized protein YndB with AHSA1/START domain
MGQVLIGLTHPISCPAGPDACAKTHRLKPAPVFATGTVHLHRVLRAPPERVYRAFLNADAMAKWLPPNGFTGRVHHLDAKVGGTFRMSFTNFTTEQSHAFGGEYLELVPNERLCYTDKFDDPNLPSVMKTTVSLKAVSCGTELGVVQEGDSRCHPGRSVLPRVAGVPPSARKARGGRDPAVVAAAKAYAVVAPQLLQPRRPSRAEPWPLALTARLPP